MNRQAVTDYLRATKHVEGWFFPIDACLFAIIDEIQKREGIAGGLFEIGAHHGKTALFLARMAGSEGTVGVCDVFDEQQLNVDRSGEGNRAVFDRHMRELAAGVHLRVFPKLSSLLTTDDTTTRVRFFHIDGGHRPEDVMSDLATADRALLPDGVIAVDDVFNPNWPGVSEGFYRFMSDHGDDFVPIAIGGNKVVLSRRTAARIYEQHLQNVDEWLAFIAPQPFGLAFKGWMGREVLTVIRKAWVDLDPAAAAALHREE